jgi:hypothetical protein
MDRRQFLLGLGGTGMASLVPSLAFACPKGQVKQQGQCVPDFADPLQGSGKVDTEHKPTLCLSVEVFRLMTEDENGQKTTVAAWDYAFWHGTRAAPYDIGTVVTGQCYKRQRVKHGTIVINWFNCREAKTGRWVRYWSATRPIVDSGEYLLTIYHKEYVDSFDSPPPAHEHWPLP